MEIYWYRLQNKRNMLVLAYVWAWSLYTDKRYAWFCSYFDDGVSARWSHLSIWSCFICVVFLLSTFRAEVPTNCKVYLCGTTTRFNIRHALYNTGDGWTIVRTHTNVYGLAGEWVKAVISDVNRVQFGWRNVQAICLISFQLKIVHEMHFVFQLSIGSDSKFIEMVGFFVCFFFFVALPASEHI